MGNPGQIARMLFVHGDDDEELARVLKPRPVSDSLLRLGEDKYSLWESSLQWLADLLLGKLEPVASVLRLA